MKLYFFLHQIIQSTYTLNDTLNIVFLSTTFTPLMCNVSEIERKKEAKQREREAREKEARKREKAEEKEKRRKEYNAQMEALAAREQQKKKSEEKKKKKAQAAGGSLLLILMPLFCR